MQRGAPCKMDARAAVALRWGVGHAYVSEPAMSNPTTPRPRKDWASRAVSSGCGAGRERSAHSSSPPRMPVLAAARSKPSATAATASASLSPSSVCSAGQKRTCRQAHIRGTPRAHRRRTGGHSKTTRRAIVDAQQALEGQSRAVEGNRRATWKGNEGISRAAKHLEGCESSRGLRSISRAVKRTSAYHTS